MKLIHLSDLHLGKTLNGFSLLEDQKYILQRIQEILDRERPDAVLISGDIYDRSAPSAEAVEACDGFLCGIADRKIPLLIISGNHDSPERLSFGSRIMRSGGVYIAGTYSKAEEPVILRDSAGEVRFYLLPFFRPELIRHVYPEEPAQTYTEAVRTALGHWEIDTGVRNVLLVHQFVIGAERSESEDITVGGTDEVDASVFEPFDYVALGHLHRAQKVGKETVRYCGTPLKYSFSEASDQKSVTVVDLPEKGVCEIRTVPLYPLRDMREIRGTFDELTLRDNYAGTATDDYLKVYLTDEEEIPYAMELLRPIYPNIMVLRYDNTRARLEGFDGVSEDTERKSEMEMFEELYLKQNGLEMSEQQKAFASDLIDGIKREYADGGNGK